MTSPLRSLPLLLLLLIARAAGASGPQPTASPAGLQPLPPDDVGQPEPSQRYGGMPRACVLTEDRSGKVKQGCVDISEECEELGCINGTVCGLNLDEHLECFPDSVEEFQNCKSEKLRLSQPCPADAGIVGFGRGCTFCSVEAPFVSDEGAVLTEPASQYHRGPPRACVVTDSESGEVKEECVEISDQCEELGCINGTICGLNLYENLQCFPGSVEEFQNCNSEELRLSHPCPADAGIVGFGQGCTFCSRNTSLMGEDEAHNSQNACVITRLSSGQIKQECIDISEQCEELHCINGTVCGLSLDEQLKCFPDSVKELQNCESEELRLTDPCPAGTKITGFGQGCTFCKALKSLRACFTGPVQFENECVDISEECEQLGCLYGEVCGVTIENKPDCFQNSLELYKNCDSEEFRLLEPCPAGYRIVGFGQGCTFCNGSSLDTEKVVPTSGTLSVTAVSSRSTMLTIRRPGGRMSPTRRPSLTCFPTVTKRGKLTTYCSDFTRTCRQKCRRGQTCALTLMRQLKCFNARQLPRRSANCGSASQKRLRKCFAGWEPKAYSAGCTHCQPEEPRRICYVRNGRPFCTEQRPTCQNCQTGTCVLDKKGHGVCVSPQILATYTNHCGWDQKRLLRMCPKGMLSEAFGVGCTYCRPDTQRACTVTRRQRRCVDISQQCRQNGCSATDRGGPRICVADVNLTVRCVERQFLQTHRKNCGTELDRLLQPCPSGGVPRFFSAGCTFCAQCLAAVPNNRCVTPELIQSRCGRIRCGRGQRCVLRADGNFVCIYTNMLIHACGTPQQRQSTPCTGNFPMLTPVAYGVNCNFCSL